MRAKNSSTSPTVSRPSPTQPQYPSAQAASTGHSYGKPYWTTEGLGNTCWISLSADDSVAVLDFGKKKELAYLAVGDHPQRIRHGLVSNAVLAKYADAPEPVRPRAAAATPLKASPAAAASARPDRPGASRRPTRATVRGTTTPATRACWA